MRNMVFGRARNCYAEFSAIDGALFQFFHSGLLPNRRDTENIIGMQQRSRARGEHKYTIKFVRSLLNTFGQYAGTLNVFVHAASKCHGKRSLSNIEQVQIGLIFKLQIAPIQSVKQRAVETFGPVETVTSILSRRR